MNKRDYLVSKGLAKPGRGRLSREAHIEIERAIADGMVFDDVEKPKKPAKIEAVSEDPPVVTESNRPIPTVVTPRVRDIGERDLIGYTKEGWRVSFITCRRCGLHANFCSCHDGLLPPSIVETLDERTLEVLG